jgi:hypothetical protein
MDHELQLPTRTVEGRTVVVLVVLVLLVLRAVRAWHLAALLT